MPPYYLEYTPEAPSGNNSTAKNAAVVPIRIELTDFEKGWVWENNQPSGKRISLTKKVGDAVLTVTYFKGGVKVNVRKGWFFELGLSRIWKDLIRFWQQILENPLKILDNPNSKNTPSVFSPIFYHFCEKFKWLQGITFRLGKSSRFSQSVSLLIQKIENL